MKKEMMFDERKAPKPRKVEAESEHPQAADGGTTQAALTDLQHHIGNQGVQRLIAQRNAQEPSELDQDTADRINRTRGGGQSLDAAVQAEMGEAMGTDLNEVRVHTSPESDALNQQLGAKAFTTGQDVFFRDGAYDPHSSAGKELIAHELTHVVQQGSGATGGGTRMTVNAPGDSYEQEADAAAKSIAGGGEAQVQRQEQEEDELQMQEMPEEEEEVQMQEEEEEVQMQEEEEEVQMQPTAEEEEEELQP